MAATGRSYYAPRGNQAAARDPQKRAHSAATFVHGRNDAHNHDIIGTVTEEAQRPAPPCFPR